MTLDPGTLLYFLAIVGGTAILGGGIAYGYLPYRQRTRADRRAAEHGAHEIYEKEDRAPGP